MMGETSNGKGKSRGISAFDADAYREPASSASVDSAVTANSILSKASYASTDSEVGFSVYCPSRFPNGSAVGALHRKFDDLNLGDPATTQPGNDSRPPVTFFSAQKANIVSSQPGSSSNKNPDHLAKPPGILKAYSAGIDHKRTSRSPRRKSCEDTVQEPKRKSWEDTVQERRKPINNLKASSVYIDNQHYVPRPGVPRPETPDPCDRNINKRPWEKAAGQWRQAWREIDGVRKLVGMGYNEKASRQAWRDAKENQDDDLRHVGHDQEAQLNAAIDILEKRRRRT
jgi:hypothetical protein